jgi:hypothetical protein
MLPSAACLFSGGVRSPAEPAEEWQSASLYKARYGAIYGLGTVSGHIKKDLSATGVKKNITVSSS